MNWKRVAVLPLFLVLGSCTEGSSRGSGITSFVQGNVASVQTVAAAKAAPPAGRGMLAVLSEILEVEPVARAQTGIEGILVSIEGTAIQGETDANGRFSLQGDFEGDVSVVFQVPDSGDARIAVNVPAAGTLTLNDVHLDTESGEALPATQDVDFEGIITEANCRDLTLTLVSTQQSPGETDVYTVRLETSTLQDAHGNPLTCGDLQGGEQASVQGVVNPDGTFGDAVIVVES